MAPETLASLPSSPGMAGPWESALAERGFHRTADAYQFKSLRLTKAGRWWILQEPIESPWAGADRSFPRAQLPITNATAAFWKCVHTHHGWWRRFEIPAWLCDVPNGEDTSEPGALSLPTLVDWALATKGGPPKDWFSPEAALVQSWLPRGALTVQVRGLVRQGEMILNDHQWSLRIPVVPHLADDLPGERREALAELAMEATRRWAMVRVGVTSEAPAVLIAEVDFTGAPSKEPRNVPPHPVPTRGGASHGLDGVSPLPHRVEGEESSAEFLFSAGLDVLRHVVAWLVETADVLGDPSIKIASLGRAETTNPKERRQP